MTAVWPTQTGLCKFGCGFGARWIFTGTAAGCPRGQLAEILCEFFLCAFFAPYFRKRAEYGFGEYGFKHRTQWVFSGSLSSGQRTQWVPLGLLFVCKHELTEFAAELTEFAAQLSEAQWVLFSETVLSKQYSARFLYLQSLVSGVWEWVGQSWESIGCGLIVSSAFENVKGIVLWGHVWPNICWFLKNIMKIGISALLQEMENFRYSKGYFLDQVNRYYLAQLYARNNCQTWPR